MADSIGVIASNYEKYKEYYTTSASDTLTQTDFLSLMVAQLKNQDFTNPTDNTEFIAQMAQFSSLQAMTETTYYSTATYASSLVGKTVTIAATDASGNLATTTDVVSSIKFNGKAIEVIVGGKTYSLSNVMEVKATSATTSPETEALLKAAEAATKAAEAATKALKAGTAEEDEELEEIVAPNYNQDIF